MPTVAISIDTAGAGVALCAFCAKQRRAASAFGGPSIDAMPFVVVSGCCHDCGAGYCLCGGHLDCERCPRSNARVIVQVLTLYRLQLPRTPSTIPPPRMTP